MQPTATPSAAAPGRSPAARVNYSPYLFAYVPLCSRLVIFEQQPRHGDWPPFSIHCDHTKIAGRADPAITDEWVFSVDMHARYH